MFITPMAVKLTVELTYTTPTISWWGFVPTLLVHVHVQPQPIASQAIYVRLMSVA